MKVTLTKSHQNPPEIRQCRPRRDWMDGTYRKHAYKCLPMTAANTYGWELVLPQEVKVIWDGGNTVPRVLSGEKITWNTDGHEYERDVVVQSIIGMVSFATGWAINPPEGYSVWLSGAPNHYIKHAHPLTAMMPGWWPDEPNMNWIIDTPNVEITFPEGMPFMFFQIIPDHALEDVRFQTRGMWEEAALMEQRSNYGNAKAKKMIDEPWTWMGGIRTGLDEKGEQIGPKHDGHPVLDVP